MPWLTHADVRDDMEARVSDLTAKIDGRRAVASPQYDHAEIAAIVGNTLAAGNSLKKKWFYSSLGIDWGEGDRETWYVAKAPVAAIFANECVVHWTHWIGRLYTQIREHQDVHGEYPDVLEYGPPNQESKRAVGPFVRYQFTDGKLVNYDFTDSSGVFAQPAEGADAGTVAEMSARVIPSGFGLKDIIELRDLAQDDQIRGPMAGVYILTGGPGVGKTTVALHRIPYLILEQASQLAAEMPGVPRDFFRTESIHVVVWKAHLVPYLKQCLGDLGFGEVGVHHVEDWVARTLRDYVRIGRGTAEYQIESSAEPEEFRRMKLGSDSPEGGRWLGLSEGLLEEFLTGKVAQEFRNPLANQLAEEFGNQLEELSDLFRGSPMRPQFRDLPMKFTPTVEGIETAIRSVRAELDRLNAEAAKAAQVIREATRTLFNEAELKRTAAMGSRVRNARDLVTVHRQRLIEFLTSDYPSLLSDFYQSSVVVEALAERFGLEQSDRFSKDACGRIGRRRLTKSDRYLLLWLIHLLTRDGKGSNNAGAMRRYSHTVVDEAQYYEPLVLRLLVDLAQPPLRSVTIVGDLEQKVSSDGGIIDWSDVGIRTERSKVFRLNTNYRWSEAVFGFLEIYRSSTNLQELSKPRRWASGKGLKPSIASCQTEDEQVSWLVERISELRREDWSIAVIVPRSLGGEWRDRVIAELGSCDIRSRWAVGEDVRECEEQIILTDYESVVGLEFDVVLLPGCERVLAPPAASRDATQAAWVALTRARQYVGVSHVDPIAIFNTEPFQAFRLTYILGSPS